MSWGFERGKIYNRKQDIHAKFGGQEQGGIISPRQHNIVIIITGPKGHAHGYADRERADGVFEYFGAGREGDMQMTDRNKAIFEHSKKSKSLLAFEEAGKNLRFKGEYVLEGFHYEQSPDEAGTIRRAIVFELRPIENIEEVVDTSDEAANNSDLSALRTAAIAASQPTAPGTQTIVNAYQRSRAVKTYVLRRANGHCEADGVAAPFLRANGEPYLEPHHILRVSDGGPDDIHHVIALCPNCHRRAHHGADATMFNNSLIEKMKEIEPN